MDERVIPTGLDCAPSLRGSFQVSVATRTGSTHTRLSLSLSIIMADAFPAEEPTTSRRRNSIEKTTRQQQPRRGSGMQGMEQRRGSGMQGMEGRRGSVMVGRGGKKKSVFDSVPPEYLVNPPRTDPVLHYLPKLDQTLNLRQLLKAANADIRLHTARVQAAVQDNHKLIRTYQLEKDPVYAEKKKRLAERQETILETSQLDPTAAFSVPSGVTAFEKQQLQLAHWKQCLEHYVMTNNNRSWQSLLEQLLDGLSEDQDMSALLQQAVEYATTLVTANQAAVHDAADVLQVEESAYVVRLQAHQFFARACLATVESIEQQFQSAGKAALQIGHQLEHAEQKRSACEAGSVLIRRWWILEALAEQDQQSPIAVQEEVLGLIPSSAARLDHLFTKPENSLEASRALQQLRAVARHRSAKVDHTANLIQRVSDALEQRLLTRFTKVYTSSDAYDFTPKPKADAVDWRELRSLATALLLFDSGRNLHKRYVDMVVSSRFPELFNVEEEQVSQENSMADMALDTFEPTLEATRSELSTLFHKIATVCTAEFELIAHVYAEHDPEMPLTVARALLQRVVSDPTNGLQAKLQKVLQSMDQKGDFAAGSKKLDTFVIVQEKAANLFSLLKDAANRMGDDKEKNQSLKGFLNSQELALSNTHRQSYIHLELRLLHHDCCASLDQAGCTLVKGPLPRPDESLVEKGILEEYKAPLLPLYKPSLGGLAGILSGPLKASVTRQPLVHAADALARARLMFGTDARGETTARVLLNIFNQMTSFYGEGFLYPIAETLRDLLPTAPPSQPPQLPFDEEQEAPDLGVAPAFWVALERIHAAAKSFDRECWSGSQRVLELLTQCQDEESLIFAKGERTHFYAELERRGEAALLQALDALSTHVQWVLVTGGESMLANGGKRLMGLGSAGGPYAIPSGSSLDTPNSPAVKALVFCLRHQFVHIQAALTPEALANYWTALSMRLYDILVARVLQHYLISTVGAVILSRDVEALRSVAMLAGSDHSHWDTLREMITLYMTPPDAIPALLTDGLFGKFGRDPCLVFLSRRNDYRYKTAAGMRKSVWVTEMLGELNVPDPTDGTVNIGLYAAGRKL